MSANSQFIDRLERSYRETFEYPKVFPTYEDYCSVVVAKIHEAIIDYDPRYLFPHDAAVMVVADVLERTTDPKADTILKMQTLLISGERNYEFARQGIELFDRSLEPPDRSNRDFLHYLFC